jgi:purine-binding chemotaxis protein CheW
MEHRERSEGEGRTPAEQCQLLTFTLAGEEYGVDIRHVQEIKCWSAITPIPNAPPHIKGVMNLRGTIIPIIDLRAQFAMPEMEYTRFTVIIVVEVNTRVQGLVVDAVSEVLGLASADVHPPPDLGGQVDARFITGMVQRGEKLVTVLDIATVLAGDGAHGAPAER